MDTHPSSPPRVATAVLLGAALLVLVPSSGLRAQTCVTPVNTLHVPSDTTIVLCPGGYTIDDTEEDGVIRIENVHNVTIDGRDVWLSGSTVRGYGILIRNSSRIRILNFRQLSTYFYAIRVEHSDSVTISGCNLSNNRVDYAGFINVWADVAGAHGGSVLLYDSRACTITNNLMNESNDGVAMYHSRSVLVADNNLSYNTAYAVRMYFSDSCSILRNDGSHIYREDPVNSDAGAILMIVSNDNRIEHNDFSFSSDGVFLGQYGHHLTPNNNTFLHNDCSYSPHNAFEATFADGNVFKHNKANYSGYGFWLGYSFNTVVDSNEIIGNHEALSVGTAGIAIDRGFNNRIANNRIENNARGIWVWEGGPIGGYEDQHSHDYLVEGNTFADNMVALDVSQTADLTIRGNTLQNNYSPLILGGTSPGAVVTQNVFGPSVSFWIENRSVSPVDAAGNLFPVDDTTYIRGRIYDHEDDPSSGPVIWTPFVSSGAAAKETDFPADLTEPGASAWSVFTSDGAVSVVAWDSLFLHDGVASLGVATQSGFDVNIHRWPPAGGITLWDLIGKTSLTMWAFASNGNQGQFQAFSVRLGNDAGGYFEYTAPATLLSSAIGQWRNYVIPLAGNATWLRTTVGNVRMDSISYVEVHADTWGGSFVLWLDGMAFQPTTSLDEDPPEVVRSLELAPVYPNPFNGEATLEFTLPRTGHVTLTIHDILGREVARLQDGVLGAGLHRRRWNPQRLASGSYAVRLRYGDAQRSRTVLLLR